MKNLILNRIGLSKKYLIPIFIFYSVITHQNLAFAIEPSMDFMTAKHILLEPIIGAYSNNQAQSPIDNKISELHDAIIILGEALIQGNELAIQFINENQFKVGYWLTYFTLDYANKSSHVLRKFLTLSTEPNELFIKIFNSYGKILGANYLKNILKILTAEKGAPNYIIADNEPIVLKNTNIDKLLSSFIQTLYLTPKSEQVSLLTFDYSLFQGSLPKLIEIDFVNALLDLHHNSKIDIVKAFINSSPKYTFERLSYVPRDNSQLNNSTIFKDKNIMDNETHSEYWLSEVSKELGPIKMSQVIQTVFINQSKSINVNDNLKNYTTTRPSYLEYGILSWIFIKGPIDLRNLMIEWVLKTAYNGKDWHNFNIPDSPNNKYQLEYFNIQLNKAITKYVNSIITDPKKELLYPLDFLAENKFLNQADFELLTVQKAQKDISKSYDKTEIMELSEAVRQSVDAIKSSDQARKPVLSAIKKSVQNYMNSELTDFLATNPGYDAIKTGEVKIGKQITKLTPTEIKLITYYLITGSFSNSKLLDILRFITENNSLLRKIIIDNYERLDIFAIELLLSRIKYNLAIENKGKTYQNFEMMLAVFMQDQNLQLENSNLKTPLLNSFIARKESLRSNYQKSITSFVQNNLFINNNFENTSQAVIFEKIKSSIPLAHFLVSSNIGEDDILFNEFKIRIEVRKLKGLDFPMLTELQLKLKNSHGIEYSQNLNDVKTISYTEDQRIKINFYNDTNLIINTSLSTIVFADLGQPKVFDNKKILFKTNFRTAISNSKLDKKNIKPPKLIHIVKDDIVYPEILVNLKFANLYNNQIKKNESSFPFLADIFSEEKQITSILCKELKFKNN
jgi:hypothetical protein